MGRQARVYIEGVLYFVTSKCGHAYNLFNGSTDYQEYISLIDKYKKQYGFKLFAYVLMPTHLHLLIELKNNVSISNIMHNLNSLYTKLYNGKYGKKGHLFQARFRTVMAEKDYLLPLARHAHLKPLTENAVVDLRQYAYSSYPQFLDPSKRLHPDMRNEISEIFAKLGGAEKEFEAFTLGASQEDTATLEKILQKRQILGSPDFISRLKKTIEESAQRSKRASRRAAWIAYSAFGSAAIIVLAVSVFMYRGTVEFKSRYYRTLATYERTIALLKGERDRAIGENKSIEDYAWKIELAENALNQLRVEKETMLKAEKTLDGYSWSVTLKQAGGANGGQNDTLSFRNNVVESSMLGKRGFAGTGYSKREKKDGVVEWETVQRNGRGERANWRGSWDGDRMTGVVRVYSIDGKATDYSFTSTGVRSEEALVPQAAGGAK